MKRRIYITLFTILYIAVGLVSTIHAIQLFNLANNYILAVILAITFEIGQAVVLFSILTSKKTQSKIMPWILMFTLTLVQVLGNVFSSYKYLILHSYEDLKYFKEPIFVWTDLPDNITTVILTYIIGAILPIVALCMTSMLNNYLESTEDELNETNQIQQNNIENETPIIEDTQDISEQVKQDNKEIETTNKEKIKRKSHFINNI